MKNRYAPLALACALMGAGGAHAASVTLDFNDLAVTTATTFAAPIVSAGFEINDISGLPGAGVFGVWSTNEASQADTGHAAVFGNAGLIASVKRVDGASFDLQSIDLADTYNVGTEYSYVFTFNTSGGSTTQTLTVDSLPGLQTFVLNKTQLTSFSFAPGPGDNLIPQFDNIVLNTAPVPEPGTCALMLAGLSAVGLIAKRRKA